jgi:Leucine-rich repeat (LRR) protein
LAVVISLFSNSLKKISFEMKEVLTAASCLSQKVAWAALTAISSLVHFFAFRPIHSFKLLCIKQSISQWSYQGSEGESRAQAKVCIFNYLKCPIASLDLQGLKLKTLPHCLLSSPFFSHLEKLNLSANELSTWPDFSASSRSKLNEINLSNNLITTIPESISTYKQLHALNLSHNRISALPVAFKHLKRLRILNLSSNQFQIFPEIILELAGLEELSIGFNRLKQLPENFFTLYNIKVLSLKENQLTSLPLKMCYLVTLEELDCSSNQIAEATGFENSGSPEYLKSIKKAFRLGLMINLKVVNFENNHPRLQRMQLL